MGNRLSRAPAGGAGEGDAELPLLPPHPAPSTAIEATNSHARFIALPPPRCGLLAHRRGRRTGGVVRNDARDWNARHGRSRARKRQMIERRRLGSPKDHSIGIGAGRRARLIAAIGDRDYIIPATLRRTDVIGLAVRVVRTRRIRRRLVLAIGQW